MRRRGEKRANKCGGGKKRETDVKRAKEWVARNRDLIFFVHIFGSLKDKGSKEKGHPRTSLIRTAEHEAFRSKTAM